MLWLSRFSGLLWFGQECPLCTSMLFTEAEHLSLDRLLTILPSIRFVAPTAFAAIIAFLRSSCRGIRSSTQSLWLLSKGQILIAELRLTARHGNRNSFDEDQLHRGADVQLIAVRDHHPTCNAPENDSKDFPTQVIGLICVNSFLILSSTTRGKTIWLMLSIENGIPSRLRKPVKPALF
jgi:hypothetical protein